MVPRTKKRIMKPDLSNRAVASPPSMSCVYCLLYFNSAASRPSLLNLQRHQLLCASSRWFICIHSLCLPRLRQLLQLFCSLHVFCSNEHCKAEDEALPGKQHFVVRGHRSVAPETSRQRGRAKSLEERFRHPAVRGVLAQSVSADAAQSNRRNRGHAVRKWRPRGRQTQRLGVCEREGPVKSCLP